MNAVVSKAVVIAALVVAGLSLKSCYDAGLRAEGSRAEQLKAIAAHRAEMAVLRDSLARRQTVQRETLRVAVVRRVEVRDTVERWLTDTVPVPVEVVRKIVRADSQVIAACMLTLSTCEQRVSALEADLGFSQQETALWRAKASPSLWQQFQQLPQRLTTYGLTAAFFYWLGSVR